jgi:broad specificity phosphatase PhoE
MALELFLIRHAESEWNALGRWQGHGDPPLSARGREQAVQLAESLTGSGIDRLLCSDLQRAVETAHAIGSVLKLDPEPTPVLRELNVGRWTGLTREEIESSDAELLDAFLTEAPDVRPGGPEGETRNELRARVREAVHKLAAADPNGRVAMVVHLGVVRALVPGSEPDHVEVTPLIVGD